MGRYKGKKLHFVGLGGVGMSAIADILLKRGYDISGSDIAESAVLKKLEEKGAKVFYTQKKENITDDIDIVVLSSAIHEDNSEYLEAVAKNKEIVHRSDMLAYLMEDQRAICVAGAHGKTTTSSMIALMLDLAHREPTIIVGGEIRQLGSNAKYGKSDLLVAEADESDGSFVKLHPWMTVVTNIECDHMDHYHSLAEIKEAFAQFVALSGKEGVNVFCVDCPNARDLIKDAPGEVITYGFSDDAQVQGRNWQYIDGVNKADVYYNNQYLGELCLQVPGKHNIQNALGACACGLYLGLTFAEIKETLGQFIGAKRRFQILAKAGDITVVDDYAHHPTEVAATIAAAKGCKPKRLIAVFQPHRYSRVQHLAKEFAECFHDVDQVILTDIYPAGEAPIAGVSSQLILDGVDNENKRFIPLENLPQELLQVAQNGDIILMMGAGNIWRYSVKLAEMLKEQYA